jgi:MraZ protein
VYLGVNTLNLDAKGRLAIPVKHRQAFADACGSRVVVTINPSSTDRCLWLYPENEWLNVARKLARLPTVDRKSQAYKRLLLGHASEQEIDSQGRIRLSPELQKHAGLGKKVAVVGQVNKLEIWDDESWSGNCERWLEDIDAEGSSEQLSEIAL